MKTLKTALKIAAPVLIAGGLVFCVWCRGGVNLDGLSCEQWDKLAHELSAGPSQEFFVAVWGGVDIPYAYNGEVIGECIDNACLIKPDGCDTAVSYRFKCGPQGAAWRVCSARAPGLVMRSWKSAATGMEELQWYGTESSAGGACRSHLGPKANCASLVQQAKLADPG